MANKCSPPKWMHSEDELQVVFKHQDVLLNSGVIVWGAIVQANRLLMSEGADDHPAEMIFSTDPYFDANEHKLQEIASSIYRLKGTAPDNPKQKEIADRITKESERALYWTVPKELTGGYDVKGSTMMIFRKHLPNYLLENSVMPLLIHSSTNASMIVPSQYW